MATESDARRERRAAARRHQIIDATIHIVAEKGLQQATTREIAEAADIAEGTIFNYFKTKDDLFLAMIDHVANLDYFQALLDQGLSSSVFDLLLTMFQYRVEKLREHVTIFGLLPELLRSPAIRKQYFERAVRPAIAAVEDHLRKRAARGELRDLDVPLLTRMLFSIFFGLAMLSQIGDELTLDSWDHPQAMLDVMYGILAGGVLRQASSPDADQPPP